jgi:hypothetical protein
MRMQLKFAFSREMTQKAVIWKLEGNELSLHQQLSAASQDFPVVEKRVVFQFSSCGTKRPEMHE